MIAAGVYCVPTMRQALGGDLCQRVYLRFLFNEHNKLFSERA